ncbi:MAG: hypothetical protein AAF171_02035 [Cyanobacteria bacterium P01_A01_bin.116]
MVLEPQHNLTLDITVLSQTYLGEVSLSQLARDLGADVSNVRKAKNWLIENRHPTFANYVPDSPLSPEQAEAIIRYRSYTTTGIKGDALTEKMFPNTVTAHAKKEALRDLFEQARIPPEQAAQLTHAILEIFQP